MSVEDRFENTAPPETYCPGCKQYIDVTVCHCGIDRQNHDPMELGHMFVPNGCRCGYAKEDFDV